MEVLRLRLFQSRYKDGEYTSMLKVYGQKKNH